VCADLSPAPLSYQAKGWGRGHTDERIGARDEHARDNQTRCGGYCDERAARHADACERAN
jgi:hypothetical protein